MCAALFGLIAVCSTMVLSPAADAASRRVEPAEPALQPVGAIEEEVEVAVRRGLDAGDAVDRAERAGELLRDGARRLAQPAGQRERERHGDVAERAPRRHFERHLGDRGIVGGEAVEAADGLGHAARERADGREESQQVIP